jgi:hypothetical protein
VQPNLRSRDFKSGCKHEEYFTQCMSNRWFHDWKPLWCSKEEVMCKVKGIEWKSLFILAKLDGSAGPLFEWKAAASFNMTSAA